MLTDNMSTFIVKKSEYEATVDGRRRAHFFYGCAGIPSIDDVVRIAEEGNTGRAVFVRIMHIEVVAVDYAILSFEVRASTGRFQAVKD